MHKRKSAVALLSVASNTTLVLLKLAVGLMIGSVSVISEAIHSGVDWLAAVIAWFAVRASGKPADADHQFGHEKWENFSGMIEALLIFLAAGWIIFESVKKLTHMEAVDAPAWGVAIMLVSSGLNIVVSRQLFKVGKATNSAALLADAWHLATDVWTSAGVMAGLALMWLGHLLFPQLNLQWIDPVAAILVALLIISAAWHLTLSSGRDLLDVSLPAEELEWVHACLAAVMPRACGYHGLRTRKAGHRRFIELHLEVPQQMSVADSHALTEEIESAILQHFAATDVTVHVEPCQQDCGAALCDQLAQVKDASELERGGHS
jgi:cation diffusion facilitator family transporter